MNQFRKFTGPMESHQRTVPSAALMALNANVMWHVIWPFMFLSYSAYFFVIRIHLLGNYDFNSVCPSFNSHHLCYLHFQVCKMSLQVHSWELIESFKRKIKYNLQLNTTSWKIPWDDIDQVSVDKLIHSTEAKASCHYFKQVYDTKVLNYIQGIDTASQGSFKDTVTTGFHKVVD